MAEKEKAKKEKYLGTKFEKFTTHYLGPCGSLIIATAILISGYLGSNYLKERAAAKARSEKCVLTMEAIQIYSDMMREQEEAENKLHEDMFNSSMKVFSMPDTCKLEEQILNLELLALNFHETFNLKPFFSFIREQIQVSSGYAPKEIYLTRLYATAKSIMKKQMMVLEGEGEKFSRMVDLERLGQIQGSLQLEEESLIVEGIKRNYKIYVRKANDKLKEMLVRLEIRTQRKSSEDVNTIISEYRLDYFNFPMIHNVTLLHDQRCAIVLNEFTESCADITLVTFPGSLAVRGKPYYQEVIQNLLMTGKLFDENINKELW
ncbi:MAG: hypothetical protein K8F34_16170 [Candidatus Kuenenia stuttgartiensis]|uniref:hypothetical protein n=1 Tax=Candidatus Kuenenia sp. TaxID=2499824 RepID=UPI001D8FCC30|nr:hypothetical protein [Planctomycetia bacterium]MBZ0193209.1 hypothetical protein [Candidatus Kuenenia stuttgartiensis]